MEAQAISWSICLDEVQRQKYIELFALDEQKEPVYCTLAIDEEGELGALQALFTESRISPYQWLHLPQCLPLPEQRVIQGRQYTVTSISSSLTDRALFPLRVMYLDLEVMSEDRKRFPSALRDGDCIFMASVILSDGSGKLDQHLFLVGREIEIPEVRVYSCASELILLRQLFELWIDFQPQMLITYNGETFDLPYLLERTLRYPELPLSLLSSLKDSSPVRERVIHTPFGSKKVRSLLPIGTESFDLLLYFRLSLPWLKDKKLDSVSFRLLRERKTGLEIDQLWANAVSDDPSRLQENARYALQDVRLLIPLYQQALKEVLPFCQEARILLTDLLTEAPEELITRIAYTLSPDCLRSSLPYRYRDHTSTTRPGVYQTIYAYNYTSLYVQALSASQDHLTQHLGVAMTHAPPVLRYTCFKSRYPAADAYQYFIQALKDELPSDTIMLTPYVCYSLTSCASFPLVAEYDLFWILEGGAVINREGGSFVYSGAHPFTFPFARKYIEAVLSRIELPKLEQASERELIPDRGKMPYSHSQCEALIAKLPLPSSYQER